MRLSRLQRYILEASWANRGRLARGLFNNFYPAPFPNTLRSCHKDERIQLNQFFPQGKYSAERCGIYQDKTVKQKFIVNTITKTLERLIDQGLMVGYGVRTPKKWYIKEVRLTPMGRKITKRFLGEQQKLPLK